VSEERRAPFDPIAGGHAPRREEAAVEFNRIVAFSDGVFAIAITLLVLGLGISGGSADLTHALLGQEADLLAYVISFAVVGRVWIAHHRFFAALERFDSTLMGLNLVYLACVVLIPFTSAVLGDYEQHPAAVILYAINLILVSLAFQAQIVYAYRRDLVWPQAREFERRLAGPANLVVAIVFAISIPIAFIDTLAAKLLWIVVFVVGTRVEDRIASLGGSRSD
jgi:uncharacterized membrane protein